jgi:Tfp pilus assembly protein PilF
VKAGDAEPTVDQIYQASRNGHLEQAQRMMDQVLLAHPDSSKAHYVQAELYAEEGHRERARSELARAERLKPGLPEVDPSAVRQLKATLGLPAD